MPMFCAAALERSSTRPRMNGPRSLMRTTTLLPFLALVTFSLVPKRSDLWAAVRSDGFMRSPEAVLECNAYQEAPPQEEAAWAESGKQAESATIVATVKLERRVFVNLHFPSR